MASNSKADDLAQAVSELQAQRQHHLDEIERIDATFAQYGIVPESGSAPATPPRSTPQRGPGRPAKKKKKSTKTSTRGKKAARKKKRGAVRFNRTGEDSVLAFVQSHGNPTAKEVNEHWQSEGRGGKADNALGKLVREGKLKRIKNKEGRGSRYRLG